MVDTDAFEDSIVQTMLEPLVVLDSELRVMQANAAFARVFRTSGASIAGTQLSELAGGRWNLPELHALIVDAVARQPEICLCELSADFGFGVRALVVQARALGLQEHAGPRVLLSLKDVTDLRSVEERYSHLASVVHSSTDSIFSWRLDGTVTTWNAGATTLFGYSADDMIGRPIARIMPADRPSELDDLRRRIEAGEQLDTFRTVRRRKDGSLVQVALSLAPIRNVDGTIFGASVVAREISARHAAEESLRQTLGQLQAVVSNVPISLWGLDLNGIVTLSEGRLLAKLGFEPGQLVGESALDMYRDNPEAIAYMRRALAGEPLHFTMTHENVTFETWYVPVTNKQGALVGTTGVALDITERIRLEAQLRDAHKMEAIGRLAGGIAHDFNNLLTTILGYADLVADELPPSSGLGDDIEQIRRAGISASLLTSQLLAFSGRQMLKPEIVCINDLVTRTEPFLQRIAGEQISVVTRLSPSLGNAKIDPGQMEQVIMNLAMNATDAMAEGGTLTIETANVTIDDDFAQSHVGARPGPHVMLRVTDTGIGIDARAKARIFEPFFSTKEKAKGTGLGLATVYGIVQQSGGTIWVDSRPGNGSAFTVYLPSIDALKDGSSDAQNALVETGKEHILVVEDQEEVRRVVAAILRHGGYSVVQAALPHEALALIREHDTHFDLMLTDVVMPEMSGRELARAVGELRPQLKVLYMSGYAEDAIVGNGVIEPGLAFIAKPFTPKALLQAVRATLDCR